MLFAIDSLSFVLSALIVFSINKNLSEKSENKKEEASKVNKIKNQDLRIELIGPEYKAWQFGNEQSENSIKGNASDWCRVVTGRVPKGHKLTLSTEGDFAKKFVKLNHVKI